MPKLGFTLMETLVVIIIIGILASLGTISYSGVRERAIGKEAKANLRLIAAAEKIYRMEYGFFYPSTGNETLLTNINSFLRLSLTARNWDYSINPANTIAFTAYADRSTTTGTGSDCKYKINEGTDLPIIDSGICP